MHSDALDVDGYLAALDEPRRGTCAQLRELCRQELVGFDEQMAYGMPGYARDGVLEIGFASQRRYVSLYVLRDDVMARHRDRLPASTGKGCVRYRSAAAIEWEVVRDVLGDCAATRGDPC